MVDGGLNGERLAEVSRLAGVLADEVLRESGAGESGVGQTAMAKLTALGKAALLLQDYDRPIPDGVVDVLSRALRGEDEGAAEPEPEPGPTAAEAAGTRMVAREAPWRLFPRLIQSLRPPRG